MTTAVELEHTYTPRGAARELLRRREKEVLLSGPAGTGKSRACLEKVNLAALKYPGMRALIVRQVRDTLSATGLKTLEEFVIPEQLAAGAVTYKGATGREPARYRWHNGSELWVAGMDRPTKIMSTEFDMIYIQEATELSPVAWESLSTRLRRYVMPYRQLIADCNPDAPTHWLRQRVSSGQTTMLESRHEDNPLLFDDAGTVTPEGVDYIATLDALTGVRKDRLRYGRWASAEGVIFDQFDAATNMVDPFRVPKDWPRIWTVDFGHVHPFVAQWWAIDPDGKMYRYREIHMSGRMVEDHAKKMMAQVLKSGTWLDSENRWEHAGWREPMPQAIICDHDTEDRDTLRKYLGMPNIKANKSVKRGLEAVNKRFRDKRLFLVRGALIERDQTAADQRKPIQTEDEIGGYVWDANKEQPIKEDDDGCDAMRYAVAHQDLKGRGNVLRWLD